MTRRARTTLVCLAAIVAVLAAGAFLWLPWNPFEGAAGPLDAWVPADADAVVRLDAGALRDAPVLHALWDGPAGMRLRRETGLDEALVALRDADARLAGLPFAGRSPPTILRDLAGGEVLLAVRGDDVLLLSRVTNLGRAIGLVRRAGGDLLAQWGVRLEGDGFVLRRGEGPELRFAVRRDVLVVSASKPLFDEAMALASGKGDSIVTRAQYGERRPPVPVGARVHGWAEGLVLRRVAGRPPIGASLVHDALAGPVRFDVDATAPDSISVALQAAGAAGDVSGVAPIARRFALDGEAFASGALPLSARESIAALFESQPPARRQLVDELLKERGSSVDDVVADLSRHFADGVGFVVARLPETDELHLDDVAGDPVEPIPATLAVLRLTGGDAAEFLADLRRHAEALFGEGTNVLEEPGPGGWNVVRPRSVAFGPEWAMLRPAFAMLGDTVVFSTNDGYLRRALAHEVSVRRAKPSVAELRIDVPVYMRRLADLRWDAADRATYHDWAAERSALLAELAQSGAARSPGEADRIASRTMRERIAKRATQEFPGAVRAYLESIAWLGSFGTIEAHGAAHEGELRLSVTIGVRVP